MTDAPPEPGPETGPRMTIALLGGAGKEGSGLALRWANVGHSVVIDSRGRVRAAEAAASIDDRLGRDAAPGIDNLAAAQVAEIVVLAVPYAAQIATVEAVRDALAGKILIYVTVPLVPPKVARGAVARERFRRRGGAGAARRRCARGLCLPEHLTHHLVHLDAEIDFDVLVCADDKAAGELVVALEREIGLGAFYAGVLANSVVGEALTSVLIALNQRYKVPGAGIRLTGIPRD